jgi:pimeloyl-ACP methyl ester carboxylesterase
MTPIYFDGCFGWLHVPAAATETTPPTGVVLCAAFAQEEMCTHYGMLALADSFAAMGMPTIRFDYRGAGNSIPAEITFDTLIQDTEHAAACLRSECGVGAIVLAGVRLGAAVAFRAASVIPGVGALALMAPALSGKGFMRETRASAKVSGLSHLDPVPTVESGLPLNTNGFHWSCVLQQQVEAIDLAAEAPLTIPTLILHARGDRRTAKFIASWRSANLPITEAPFSGYEEWMKDPTTSEIPAEAFNAARSWLASLPIESQSVPAPVQNRTQNVFLSDTFVEVPIQFGPNNALFGVLCRPRDRAANPVAALLLHEGSSHHIGDGGAYVPLARRLAEQGIASFRMDLTGMGDSPAGDNPRHPHYDPERIAEAFAGVGLLEERGSPRIVVFGLCAGAYTAMQVALADARIVGAVIVNLQKFIWHYGDDIRIAVRQSRRSFKAYLRATTNSGEWKRTLTGKVNVKAVVQVLVTRTAKSIYNAARTMLPPAPGSETARVHQQMKELAQRGVHTHLIFSDDDPGLTEMFKQFGRKARRLAAFAPARMVLLKHADHHFNGTSVRQRYNDLALTIMQAAIAEFGEITPPSRPRHDRRRRPRGSHYTTR